MAIVREGTLTFETGGTAATSVSESHTVQSGTTICIFALTCDANIDITTVPKWNGDAETFTLIHETTPSGSANDMHTYTYGLVSPTAKADNITFVIDSTAEMGFVVCNYSGTISSSVAAATNFLNEDADDFEASTSVHGSAGTTGATLFTCSGFHGADGDPVSNNASFTEIFEGDDFGGSGIAYYFCEKIGGAPTGVTITWQSSDEQHSQMIEILEAAAASNSPTGNIRGTLYGCLAGVI